MLIDEDIPACDEVIAQLGSATDIDSRERVAHALALKAGRLRELGCAKEAVVVWEELVVRYHGSPEPELRPWVERALNDEGLTLIELKRRDEALLVYRKLAPLYVPGKGPRFNEVLARAMRWWAGFGGQKGKRLTERLLAFLEARFPDARRW